MTTGAHRPGRQKRSHHVMVTAGLQVLLLFTAWQLYRYGRFKVRDQRTEALHNASTIMDLENRLQLFVEPSIQRLAMVHEPVMRVLNHYYVYMHVLATLVCLCWLYGRHRVHYQSFRRVLFAVMPVGLLIHAAYPLAPPRLAHRTGMVDTLAVYGPSVYSHDQYASITNQFAAMPSFHVGWSALVALYVIRHSTARSRWVVLLHPLVMCVTVMATANHYLMDAVVGTLVVMVGVALEPVLPTLQFRSDRPAWLRPRAG